MPSRNVQKEQVPQSYYHVYARGVSKQKIFNDPSDYEYFLMLFERYLSKKQASSSVGYLYPNFFKKINLLSYCLMPNHFHLLVYQEDIPELEKFMRSLMTSYSRYFNLKHKRTGPLFESRYKASRIKNDSYLQHISRYIHLNPNDWETYQYSSLQYFMTSPAPDWINPKDITSQFRTVKDYLEFVAAYKNKRDILQELKEDLADW